MKPLPNLLFVKTVAEIQEDGMAKIHLGRFINDSPRVTKAGMAMSYFREDVLTKRNLSEWLHRNTTLCKVCRKPTAGQAFCGLCSSALVESQINTKNLPTAR